MTKGIDVHSGIKFHPDVEASKHPDRHIHLPAYTSTSLRPLKARTFASLQGGGGIDRHVLSIHVKKGQNALPILHNSSHLYEDEVLLPRDTTLKVAAKPHKIDGENGGIKTHYWKAHIVHQGEE